MKVVKEILLITLVIILSLAFVSNISMANYDWSSDIDTIASTTVSGDGATAVTSVNNVGKAVITIARVICMGVAVTMLIVLGIKYMSAAPGEKATFKKSAVTYVVGAVIMFAATGILSIIQKFASGI